MRAAGSAAVRRGVLGLVVVTGVALVTGVPVPGAEADVAPGQTGLVTRPSDGSLLVEDAVETAISGDGRHIVFSSRGSYTDLDNNGTTNVFARDLETGVTTQVSLGHEPTEGQPVYDQPPNGDSNQPAISASGRFVAFVTTAMNITPDSDDYGPDVVVLDRDSNGDNKFDNSAPRYRRVSDSTYNEGDPRTPRLSASGARVLWTDREYVGQSGWVVRYRDLLDGAPSSEIVDISHDWINDSQPVGAYDGALSADGTHAAMVVDYREPVPGLRQTPLLRLAGAQDAPDPDFSAIIVVNLATEEATRADFDEDGGILGTSRAVGLRLPTLSADGSVVAYESEPHIYAGEGVWDPLFEPDVHVVRRAEERSRIVSRDIAGELRNGARPDLSDDARYIAFVTDSLNMHDGVDSAPVDNSCLYQPDFQPSVPPPPPPADTREARTDCQVVVRDLVLDAASPQRLPGVLASPGIDTGCVDVLPPGQNCAGRDDSGLARSSWILDLRHGEGVPSLTTDGSRVAFDSRADDLVPDDNNKSWDGFVRTFQPSIAADPVAFGTAEVGTTVNRTATLRVVGAGPVTIASITVDGADFTAGANTCVGVALHRAGECLAGVAFTPTATGPRTGRLVIRLADGREFGTDLTGDGSAVPVIPDGPEFSATPSPLDFGPRLLLSTDPTGTVTITNAGGSPMTVASVAPGLPGDFSVQSTDCVVVAPGASCSVIVRFRPTVAGPRSGSLVITSDALGGPHLVGLSGVGSTPALIVNPGVSRPGRVTTVSGTGFPANVPVTVRYLESVEVAKAVTSNEGAFSVSMLVFPKAAIGQRTVVATVDGVVPEIGAKGLLLVVYPSMSPPEFLTRG